MNYQTNKLLPKISDVAYALFLACSILIPHTLMNPRIPYLVISSILNSNPNTLRIYKDELLIITICFLFIVVLQTLARNQIQYSIELTKLFYLLFGGVGVYIFAMLFIEPGDGLALLFLGPFAIMLLVYGVIYVKIITKRRKTILKSR